MYRSGRNAVSYTHLSSLARYGGDVAVGAMTVITSASQLCTLPIQGICEGGQPVMSFNCGAGKKARVKEAVSYTHLDVYKRQEEKESQKRVIVHLKWLRVRCAKMCIRDRCRR